MAKRSFEAATWTPTATADTTNLANSTYMAIEAGSATQYLNVIEIYEAGLATSSTLNTMLFARSSTFGATVTALASPNSDGPLNTATAALAIPPVTYVATGVNPQRSSSASAARLNLSFNSFGGIVRWVAAPGEEWGIIGQTVSVSGSTLSGVTSAAGSMASHIIYEPF